MKKEDFKNYLNIFDKKNNVYENLKEKIISYTNLSNKFKFWDYIFNNEEIKESYFSILLFSVLNFGFFLIPVTIFLSKNPSYNVAMLMLQCVFASLCLTACMRNLKFGLMKKRYENWLNVRKEIVQLIKEDSIWLEFILQIETDFINIKNNFSLNEEMEKIVKKKMNTTLDEIKNDLMSNSNNISHESILNFMKTFNIIENSKNELLSLLRTYQLNEDYTKYKKNKGFDTDMEATNNTEQYVKVSQNFKIKELL